MIIGLGTRVQEELLNVPVPLVANATVPVGGLAVLTPLESVTVAVQAVADPIVTDAGKHSTAVVVGSRFATVTVRVKELTSCVVSPP